MNSGGLNSNYKQGRLLTFFRNQKFVDCTFKIDGQEIKAHKLILACSSPVFEKMFYGGLASSEIMLEDIQVEEFIQLLEFIYTHQINFSNSLNAWSMFYVAKKYILDDLIDVCLDYISEHLTMSTLVLSYEYSELYNLEQMKKQCFRDIIEAINGVFMTDYHMKPSTLKNILKENLAIRKVDLTCKIVEWTINECEFRSVTATPENIVQILKDEDILKYINKKCLLETSCEYCNDSVVVCQCIDELVHKTLLLLSSSDELSWQEESEIDRFTKFAPVICKTRKVYKIAQRVDLQDSQEIISSVSVNTDVVVSGIFLCTEMNSSFASSDEYKGCVSIRFCEQDSDKSIMKPTIMYSIFPYNSQAFIPLRYAVTLTPGNIYDIRITYKNFCSENHSSVVCSYMSEELVDKKRGYSKMFFYDFCGTVIKGVAYYPV